MPKKKEKKPPYVHQNYPRWMYHPKQGGKIVKDPSELASLGPDWFDTPDCEPAEAKALPKKTVVEDEGAEVKGDPHDGYYKMNEAQALDKIEIALNALQLDVLLAMQEKETAHPKKGLEGGRKGVQAALEDAIAKLEMLR